MVSPQRCGMTLYNQDSTSIEMIKASIHARRLETLIVEFQCKNDDAGIIDGTSLYLVVLDSSGKPYSVEGPVIAIDGIEILAYAQAIYQSEKGVRFEVNPTADFKWRKGEAYMLEIYTAKGLLRKKVILLR